MRSTLHTLVLASLCSTGLILSASAQAQADAEAAGRGIWNHRALADAAGLELSALPADPPGVDNDDLAFLARVVVHDGNQVTLVFHSVLAVWDEIHLG